MPATGSFIFSPFGGSFVPRVCSNSSRAAIYPNTHAMQFETFVWFCQDKMKTMYSDRVIAQHHSLQSKAYMCSCYSYTRTHATSTVVQFAVYGRAKYLLPFLKRVCGREGKRKRERTTKATEIRDETRGEKPKWTTKPTSSIYHFSCMFFAFELPIVLLLNSFTNRRLSTRNFCSMICCSVSSILNGV